MISLSILCLISLVGLVFSLMKEGVFQKLITSGLVATIFLAWVNNEVMAKVGTLMQLVIVLLIVVYPWVQKNITKTDCIIITLVGLIFSLRTIFAINNYPFKNELTYGLAISVILFLVFSFKHYNHFRKEFGFMLILASMATMLLWTK